METVAQQVQIDSEVENEAEAGAAQAESVPEPVDLLPEFDETIIELSADDEDTDEQIDCTVPEYWENADMEAV